MHSLFFMGRHGETMLNDSGRYRGWSNGPDAQLNETGRMSAHRQGQFLATLGQKFSKIISSPFDRAVLTAAIIAQYIGIEDIQIDERLKPLNVGEFAGELKADHPISPYLKNPKKKFPGGESVSDFEARQYAFALELLDDIESVKSSDDSEILVIAHVSNVMYWWNAQRKAQQEEYLDEASDIVKPGGLVAVTEHAAIPIFKANEDADAEGGNGGTEVTQASIKGEPGTGYESGAKGAFRCDNCEYFRASDSSCGQKDMMAKSERARTKDERVNIDADGCCEYVDRPGGEDDSDGADTDK